MKNHGGCLWGESSGRISSVGVMKALFLLDLYDCVLNVDDILPLETSRASAAMPLNATASDAEARPNAKSLR